MCYLSVSFHLVPVLCVIWPPRYPSSDQVLDTHPTDCRAVFPSEKVRNYNVRQRHSYGGHLVFMPAYLGSMALLLFLYL